MTTTTYAQHLIVIACAADKMTNPAPAVELYDSPNFRHTLGMAMAHALASARQLNVTTKVMILSAQHGLTELGEIIAPYNTKMGQAGSVTTDNLVDELFALAPTTVESFLPKSYHDVLRAAVDAINYGEDEDAPWIELVDVYEAGRDAVGGQGGVGFHRGVASSLMRTMGV